MTRGQCRIRGSACALSAALAVLLAGCFSERDFPMRVGDVRLASESSFGDRPLTTREWLRRVQGELAPLIPEQRGRTLLTEEMVGADGRAIDVSAHFGEPFEAQHTLLGNLYGLMHTAQSSGAAPAIEQRAPAWEGFEDVWIPVGDGLYLSGRLGLARSTAHRAVAHSEPPSIGTAHRAVAQSEPASSGTAHRAVAHGEPIVADCIVIMPGLLGDLAVKRSKQLAAALRASGFHVLCVELRGYGQTENRNPTVPYHFGVEESGDLLAVAEWLQARPEVRRTGLIGFCWGSNHALLAAFEDGRPDVHPSVSPALQAALRPRTGARHYEAGVMVFSPCLRFEETIDRCDRDWAMVENPVLSTLQDGIRFRKNWKGHADRNGSLRTLIEYEFSEWTKRYPLAVADALDYLRMLPYEDRPAGDKLESCRVPVLIVHGRNDPLADAQEVADCVAQTANPNVAGLILPGGGHVGFAAWSREYFYSLVLNFFDPQRGAAAMMEPLRYAQ